MQCFMLKNDIAGMFKCMKGSKTIQPFLNDIDLSLKLNTIMRKLTELSVRIHTNVASVILPENINSKNGNPINNLKNALVC